MVGHHQAVRPQRRQGRRSHQGLLLFPLDVSGQQQRAPLGIFNPQHAAQGVGLEPGAFIAKGVQHLKAHTIPAPGLPSPTGLVGNRRFQERMGRVQTGTQARHRQPLEYGCGTPRMVQVAVRHHQFVQASHSQVAQDGQHHAITGITTLAPGRSCIQQQRVVSGAHQHRTALPHIQGPHLKSTRRGPLRRR